MSPSRGTPGQTVRAERRIISYSAEVSRRARNTHTSLDVTFAPEIYAVFLSWRELISLCTYSFWRRSIFFKQLNCCILIPGWNCFFFYSFCKAETGVIAPDDLPDEPGDDMDLVEVGVACSDDASSKASGLLTTVIQLRILFPQPHW